MKDETNSRSYFLDKVRKHKPILQRLLKITSQCFDPFSPRIELLLHFYHHDHRAEDEVYLLGSGDMVEPIATKTDQVDVSLLLFLGQLELRLPWADEYVHKSRSFN